jgi:hypothetical protein
MPSLKKRDKPHDSVLWKFITIEHQQQQLDLPEAFS